MTDPYIEAIVEAMVEAISSKMILTSTVGTIIRSELPVATRAALAAALGVMETPDEEMLKAGASIVPASLAEAVQFAHCRNLISRIEKP